MFAYPFRVFFLSVAAWALVAVLLWVPQVTGWWQLPLALDPLAWHRHEMLFGILSAAIAGFLLTAVCVWTGTERLHSWSLLALWLVWLAGRILLLVGASLPEILVIGLNLLFLPLVMLDAGRRIWRARQQRHLIVLLAVGLIWVAQAVFLLLDSAAAVPAALVGATLLMLVIGGRITPTFSAGWLRMQGGDPGRVRIFPWLEYATLGTVVALFVLILVDVGGIWTLVAALVAALVTGARLAAWRGWLVRRDPLLWILHLSLLWIPVALLLLAGAEAGWWPATVWYHALGIGAMGGLILGVISRVSLGHTGRPLVLPRGMVVAFVLVHASAVVRVVTAFGGLSWQTGVSLSALLWMLAFALFLWRYGSILIRPRVDEAPG
jgi:uncharacterized protein involved in response to NO